MTPDQIKRLALAFDEVSQALLASIDDGVSSTPPFVQAAPAAQVAPAPENVGFCPKHGTPWTTTKGDGTPAKRAYCKTKDGDEWCAEKGPWLQPKRS